MSLRRKLIVDLFAGGGGASEGMERGLGRQVDIAINHDPVAMAMHLANHPATQHHVSDVFEIDPREATGGKPVGLLWASPDCKHFSKAKGGKPRSDRIRSLAWVVVNWARDVQPDVIILENVEEFTTWGPLLKDGRPCPRRKGRTFEHWKARLKNLGYVVDHRELRACDYGAPTIRKRFFFVARRDGKPIRWPAPTHGRPNSPQVRAGFLKPWRTAAECIDWSRPCPSIFTRKRPLADATMRRIAKGIKRYVIDSADPFIVPMTHGGDDRVHGINEPVRTVTTANRGELAMAAPVLAGVGGRAGQTAPRGLDEPYVTTTTKADMGLAAATLIQTGYGERPGQSPRVPGLDKPLGTIVAAAAKHAVVTATMLQNNGGFNRTVARDVTDPVSTVTATGAQQGLIAAMMSPFYGSSETGGQGDLFKPAKTVTADGQHHGLVSAHLMTNTTGHAPSELDGPAPTLTTGGQQALVECELSPEATECALRVAAFLMKYYGEGGQWQGCSEPMHTMTTKDRLALVTVVIKGRPYVIVDIGLRMLEPRELFRAQGFREDYIINPLVNGKPITKTAQVRCCGNSVPPDVSEALSREQFLDDGLGEMRAVA